MFESLVVLDCAPGSKLVPGARLGGQRAAEVEALAKKNTWLHMNLPGRGSDRKGSLHRLASVKRL